MSRHNPLLKEKLKHGAQNAKYTHHSIQNEIISISAKLVSQEISNEVRECDYFAVMVDETKDISKTEQISVVVRYNFKRTVYERF